MPLIDFWRNSPDSIRAYAIRQVVAIAGEGRLRDGGDCSNELRGYLRETASDKLADYASECLQEAFDDGGLVLQDVVGKDAVHVLGCMDLDRAFVVPYVDLEALLPKLNQTVRNGNAYWHVVITTNSDGSLALYSSRTGEQVPLEPYSMPI